MNTNNIYWIAGLLEGEGWFSSINNRGARTFRIGFGSTDEDIAQRASNILHGTYRNLHLHGNGVRDGYAKKRLYGVAVNGNLAIQWMMTIYPLMSKRRKAKILDILSEWKLYADRSKGYKKRRAK